jgi:hypothetical protein
VGISLWKRASKPGDVEAAKAPKIDPVEAAKFLLTGLASIAVGLAIGHFILTVEKSVVRTRLLPPDTPPAEYLYLDEPRVLAYLGQINGGLTNAEKRTASESESVNASLNPGLLGDVGASSQNTLSVEQVVTPDTTDRFLDLLNKLRSGQQEKTKIPWLTTIDLGGSLDKHAFQKTLSSLQVGNFVRLSHAHLVLPAYAAVAPKVRYAVQTGAPHVTPTSVRQRRQLNRYLRRLGANPALPFFAKTLEDKAVGGPLVTFFVPAGYASLLDNDRLLAADLTVVGKVVYLNVVNRCIAIPGCKYSDQETVGAFTPALRKASPAVLARLGLQGVNPQLAVAKSVTFAPPVVVVLPIAIYQ